MMMMIMIGDDGDDDDDDEEDEKTPKEDVEFCSPPVAIHVGNDVNHDDD